MGWVAILKKTSIVSIIIKDLPLPKLCFFKGALQ